MAKNDDKYTDPEFRSQIKEEVQAGDKGGQPGQWSARKAQMMASEYKKQMHERGEEPYTTDKSERSEGQKHLDDWTKEEWQTSEGKGAAKQDDGTEQRYLPRKAWENMTEEEKQETNKAKLEGSASGKQHVPNTTEAKKARKDAQESEKANAPDGEEAENDAHNETNDKNKEPTQVSPGQGMKHRRDEKDPAEDEGETNEQNDETSEETTQSQPPAKQSRGEDGEKRATQSHSKGESGDADESEGDGDADDEHGQPGSAKRLPNEGQKVFWRATPGWCEGIVVEVVYSEKDVDGKRVKASQDDPRIVLKSTKSGKTAVHKPEAVYF